MLLRTSARLRDLPSPQPTLAEPRRQANGWRSGAAFVKGRFAARFGVRDIGAAEGIAFLHDELFKQQDRQSEARGFRRGILISLTSCGLMLAVAAGAFLLLSHAECTSEESLSIAKNSSLSNERSWLRPTASEAESTASQAPTEPSSIADWQSDAPPAATASMPARATSAEQPDQIFRDFEIQLHHEGTDLPEIRPLEQIRVKRDIGFDGATLRPGYDLSLRRGTSHGAGVVKPRRARTAAELNSAELIRLLRGGRASGRLPLQ